MSSALSSAIALVRRGGHSFARELGHPGPEIQVAPLTGDTVTPGTGALQLASSLLAGFRARANYRQQRSDAMTRLAYMQAQTDQINAKLNAPPESTQEYAVGDGRTLNLTDPQAAAHLGQLYPKDKAEDESVEIEWRGRKWRVPQKKAGEIGLQLERFDATDERVRAGQTKAGEGRSRLSALNSLYGKAGEEVDSAYDALKSGAVQQAQDLVATARSSRDRKRREAAAIELGLATNPDNLTPDQVARAADRWVESRMSLYRGQGSGVLERRRRGIMERIQGEAGMGGLEESGASGVDALIERLNRLAEE